jgi:pentatricopeptide repeat protein
MKLSCKHIVEECIIKDFEKAENLFDEMLQRGLKPNTLTFSNLIRCAA